VLIDVTKNAFHISTTPVNNHVSAAEYFSTIMTAKEYAEKFLIFSREGEMKGVKSLWRTFDTIFERMLPLLTYEPVFNFYTKALFADFADENY
jgi:hypothetical protein